MFFTMTISSECRREQRIVDHFVDVLTIAAHQKFHGFGGSSRRFGKAGACQVLAEQRDDVAEALGHLLDDLLLRHGCGVDGLL
jgi:hypothetical protein